MVVQRKWMYLESIFIGGDIRSQLPEEARKFDEIDKNVRTVSNLSPSTLHPPIKAACSPQATVAISFIANGNGIISVI